jgi:hypothetical protein
VQTTRSRLLRINTVGPLCPFESSLELKDDGKGPHKNSMSWVGIAAKTSGRFGTFLGSFLQNIEGFPVPGWLLTMIFSCSSII